MSSKRILILVEGEKKDVELMKKLFNRYNLTVSYQIVSYKTNIYVLYNKMFKDGNPESYDLLQVLKETGGNNDEVLNQTYSDILLVFDLDPHDSEFKPEKIEEMQHYFNESTDNGKLYLNYPMVEAFDHRDSVEDAAFGDRTVLISELKNYKKIVHGFTPNPQKLVQNQRDMSCIILDHLKKAHALIAADSTVEVDFHPNLAVLLQRQLVEMAERERIYVLSTCIFFIADYDKNLLSL